MNNHPRHLQTTKNRLFSSKGLSRRQYFVFYTLIFIIMVFAVFGIFFVNDKSFVWNLDGWNQHYRALVYYAQWLRSIVRDFFSNGTLNISTFSFSIGYGSDILDTLEYYAIGDPLTILSVFVPTKYIGVFYDALLVIRLYLAGVTFSLFCFYKADQKHVMYQTSHYSSAAVMTGSFVYVFCGYGMVVSLFHPFFANVMVYFPLILLGVEKILDGKRPWLFVVMVFIAAVSNFYLLFMTAVITVLYVIIQLIVRYSRTELRTAFLKLIKIAGCAILGVCLSAMILLPVLLAALGDARTETGNVFNFFYSNSFYENLFGDFLSAVNSSDNNTLGFASIGLISVFLLFLHKKRWDLKTAFLLLGVMFLLPVVGSFMNAFSYPTNRWVWALGFLIAYIVVIEWPLLFQLSTKDRWRLTLCLGVYLLICLVLAKSRTVSAFFAIAMIFLSLALISAVKARFGLRWAEIALVLCVLINISGDAIFMYSPRNRNFINEFISVDQAMSGIEDSEAIAVNQVADGENDFFRYTGSSTTTNGSLYSGLHNTQYYWSLSNSNITRFRSETSLSGETYSLWEYTTLDSRTFLSELANVKYYVQNGGVPYGYSYVDKVENEESYADKIDTYTVWENDLYLPFGYTYDNFITQEDYECMTPIEKQEAMLQGCVVESGVEGNEAEPTFSGSMVTYEVEAGDGLTYDDGCINVTKANSTLKLTFDGIKNAETYLYVTGLNYRGYSPRELYSDEEWNKLSTYEKNEINYQETYYEEATALKVNISAQDTENNSSSTTLNYYTEKNRFYPGRKDFMINLGYDELGKVSMTLQFSTTGVYTFDSLEVLCQPMDNYEEQVSALAEDVMENVDFHENSAHATNRVTGSISLDSPKYLLLTIPYTDGWTAKVDGEEQELLQANTMYMALYLDAGEHEIELTYQTPGLTIGLIVTAASAVVFAGLIVLGEHRRRVHKTDTDKKMETDNLRQNSLRK